MTTAAHPVRSTTTDCSATVYVVRLVPDSTKNGQEKPLETYEAAFPFSTISIVLPDDPTLRGALLTGTRLLCEVLEAAERSGIIRVGSLNVHFYVGDSDTPGLTSPSLSGTLIDFLDTNFAEMTNIVTPET